MIQELLDLAKKIREEQNRGKDLGLNEDEIAFYDALADNESAKQVLGDDTFKMSWKMLYDLNNMTMLLWEPDQGIDNVLDLRGRL